MVLWFVGLSIVLVWVVFQSPALDVRFVAVGALVPWLDVLSGGPWVLHTLLGAVGALVLVMLATRGHRRLRRQLLGIPIGMFLHLVLDGTWTKSELFWWPFLGGDPFAGQLPEVERSVGVLVAMELTGAVALWWAYRAFGLHDPARRRELRESGRLRPG
jgi:hypothetical protein